jgi:hypothetical protein
MRPHRQSRDVAYHCDNVLPSGGETDSDNYLEIHQRIAGKQDREIDRERLRECHDQDGNRDELEHPAKRQPVEKGGELHDQNVPEGVTDRQRDLVASMSATTSSREDSFVHITRTDQWRTTSTEHLA